MGAGAASQQVAAYARCPTRLLRKNRSVWQEGMRVGKVVEGSHGYPALASEEPICVHGGRLRNVSKCAGGCVQRLQSQELMPAPGMKLVAVLGHVHPILPVLVIQRLGRERASCALPHQSSACRSLFQRISTLRQADASSQAASEFAIISRHCGCLPVARATSSSDLA